MLICLYALLLCIKYRSFGTFMSFSDNVVRNKVKVKDKVHPKTGHEDPERSTEIFLLLL
jgi:hypothetical protein